MNDDPNRSVLAIQLPEDLLQQCLEAAASRGMSPSAWITAVLRQRFAEPKSWMPRRVLRTVPESEEGGL